MRFVLFTHSLVSDWNHGNAHFQRGVMRELLARGHDAVACEPAEGWSRQNLVREHGQEAVHRFHKTFPELSVLTYAGLAEIDEMLDGADVVLVHEWTDPDVVAKIGKRRSDGAPFTLLFHDTHHRAISAEHEMAALDLGGYDGVLAFGEILAETYRKMGWGRRVFTWHEAADTRLFAPCPDIIPARDLIWIGNWGDGERADELTSYLVEPVRKLGLAASAYGVRYPEAAREELAAAGIHYRGWLANAAAPEAFARHRLTVHIPRRPYTDRLPGIPTIRMFEALACGIPLVSAPWQDIEGLFRLNEDYLPAASGESMRIQIQRILLDPDLADSLSRSGIERIRARHTCAHRVDELFEVLARIGGSAVSEPLAEAAE